MSDCLTAVALIFRDPENTIDWCDLSNVETLENLNLSLCRRIGDSVDQDQVEFLLYEFIREVNLAPLSADRKTALIIWLWELLGFV